LPPREACVTKFGAMTPMFRAEYAGIATVAAKRPNAVKSTRTKNFFISSFFLFLTRQYSIPLKLNRLRKKARAASDWLI
jgi:hypothetical protein